MARMGLLKNSQIILITRSTLAFAILSALSIASCDVGIEPPFELKDPRRIHLTTYSIIPYSPADVFILSVWGSSENNVYMVGFTDGRYGQMFKFDGSGVSEVLFDRPPLSGLAYQLFDIYGFAQDNILAVGTLEYFAGSPVQYYDSTAILRFDGSQWKDLGVRAKGTLQAIWGISANDIWAGGTEGTLFHYVAGKWIRVPLPREMWISSIAGSSESNVYATAYEPGSSGLDYYYLLHWNGAGWSVSDSSQETTGTEKFGFFDLYSKAGDVFTVGRQGFYKATPSGWVQLLANTSGAIHSVVGTSSSNLVLAGGNGLLLHYNGVNFTGIPGIPSSVSLYDAEIAGTSLLLVGNDFQTGRPWFFIGN